MLILNTLTIIVQVIIVGFLSILSMNIVRYFTSGGGVRNMALIAPALFVNHGGGPMPLLADSGHAALTKFLKSDLKKHVNLKDWKAIILVTAHWEEGVVSISSGERHELYFDYSGFPPETYKYQYNAPGHPELAEKIHNSLKSAGIPSKLDPKRGWDHGVFVPMMLINPAADIPIVQVSVLWNQDPEQHYKLGEVLKQFRKDGVAIVGSGMSYHNMNAFMARYGNNVINKEFDNFLFEVCTAKEEAARKEGLLKWRNHPGSWDAHPKKAAEHFMPLIVIAGAGGSTPGERIFSWDMNQMFRLSGFIWRDL